MVPCPPAAVEQVSRKVSQGTHSRSGEHSLAAAVRIAEAAPAPDVVVRFQERGMQQCSGAEATARWRPQAAHRNGAYPRCCNQRRPRRTAKIGSMILRPETSPGHTDAVFVSAWEAV